MAIKVSWTGLGGGAAWPGRFVWFSSLICLLCLPANSFSQDVASESIRETSSESTEYSHSQSSDVEPANLGDDPDATARGMMDRFEDRIDGAAGDLKNALASILFYDLSRPFLDLKEGEKGLGISAVVVYLVIAATFFTLWTRFLNIRAFKHAILITRGKYDDPTDLGEVSHFQALAAALSATVGLGNIAGVAIAIATGGPGATFWMIVAGFLGMSSKFMECTLGQKYREVRPDGRIMGGAMYYLSKGLKELGLGRFGSALGVLFAFLCIGASFGGGNAFQVSQSMNAVNEQLTFLKDDPWIYGLVMAFLTGLVILGGIRRIAHVAERIVPLMCGIYVATCVYILVTNFSHIPDALLTIIRGSFLVNI